MLDESHLLFIKSNNEGLLARIVLKICTSCFLCYANEYTSPTSVAIHV